MANIVFVSLCLVNQQFVWLGSATLPPDKTSRLCHQLTSPPDFPLCHFALLINYSACSPCFTSNYAKKLIAVLAIWLAARRHWACLIFSKSVCRTDWGGQGRGRKRFCSGRYRYHRPSPTPSYTHLSPFAYFFRKVSVLNISELVVTFYNETHNTKARQDSSSDSFQLTSKTNHDLFCQTLIFAKVFDKARPMEIKCQKDRF